MTHVSLLAIGIDSQPEDITLTVVDGMRISLGAGVHLNLRDASPATCREIARAFERAARMKDFARLPEVV